MATKKVGQFCVISLSEEDGALAVVPSLWLEEQNGVREEICHDFRFQ